MTNDLATIAPIVERKNQRTSFGALAEALDSVQVEEGGYQQVYNLVTQYGLQKSRIFFLGNGGSAAIASHQAIDWQKNGGFATFGPGDTAMMSGYSNDYGFEHVYAEQIERHGQLGDVLFAISATGMSDNILRAADIARAKRINVVTLSGFGEGNFLRTKGGINFYVPSNQYGIVELAHHAILHSILDEVIANEGQPK